MKQRSFLSSRYAVSDRDIRERADIAAVAVPGLRDMDAEVGYEAVLNSLRHTFISTVQTTRILRFFIQRAAKHVASRYTTGADAVRLAYADEPRMVDTPLIAEVMGLAGTGKTEISKALSRVLPPKPLSLAPGHEVTFEPFSYLSLKGVAGHSGALARLFSRGAVSKVGLKVTPLTGALIKQLYLSGTGGLCLDELQFFTTSAQANAKIVALLYICDVLGCPVSFTENFSLATSLRTRPQQDRDRICGMPTVVRPDTAKSQCFIETLAGFKKAAPDVFRFDPEEHAGLIHDYTFGIKRAVTRLLAASYLLARKKRARAMVDRDALLAGYRSERYRAQREDVEALWKQAHTGRKERQDLWCPLDDEGTQDKLPLQETPAFAEAVANSVSKPLHTSQSQRKKRPTGVPFPRNRGATADVLLDGARAFEEKCNV